MCSQMQKLKKCSFPEKFDPQKEQIFLHLVHQPHGFHVELIEDWKKFQRAEKRFLCLYCGTVVKTRPSRYRHTCNSAKYCFCCRRKHITPSMWYLERNKADYCDNRSKVTYGNCDQCNMTFKSEDCKKSHRSSECNRSYKCMKCGKISFAGGDRAAKGMIKLLHKCGEKLWQTCYKY